MAVSLRSCVSAPCSGLAEEGRDVAPQGGQLVDVDVHHVPGLVVPPA